MLAAVEGGPPKVKLAAGNMAFGADFEDVRVPEAKGLLAVAVSVVDDGGCGAPKVKGLG